MMKISICDDEKHFLDTISRDVKQIFQELNLNCSINLYNTGKDFLESFTKDPEVDIVFMDILLGNEDGYKVAAKIREHDQKVKIIFLTSVTKYALKGYEIKASCYLLKPVSFQKLKSVLVKMIDDIKKSNSEYIIEKNDNGIYKIFMEDIIYIETYGRNTIIHTKDQNIVSYQTMKNHLARLNTMFVRCHAGVIVNLGYVVELGKNSIKLQFGESVPLSKSRKNEVKEALISYFRIVSE